MSTVTLKTKPVEAWREQFAALASAEEYLDFFGIDWAPEVLGRNRLAILQRFHTLLPEHFSELDFGELRTYLALAYSEMIDSSARDAQLFRIFKPVVATISLDAIGGRRRRL